MNALEYRLNAGARGFERLGCGLAFGGGAPGVVVKLGPAVLSLGGIASDGGRYSRTQQTIRGKRLTTHQFAFGHLLNPAKRSRAVMLELAGG